MPATAPEPGALAGLRGATVVVKYGGAAMRDDAAASHWAEEIAHLAAADVRVVVTHGGGPALTRVLERMGVPTAFHDGHRVTDADTAEIAEMVLSGRVNKWVVSHLQRAGCRAVGLSGTDGGMLSHEPHRPGGADIGFVGRVTGVDTALLDVLTDGGFVPVVSSTAAGEDGRPHNINADLVAGALAAALGADAALFLTDVPGVIVGGEVRARLTASEAAALVASGEASGGMRPKLEAGMAALAGGVGRVCLIDGRDPGATIRRLVTAQGPGTRLVPDPGEEAP
ncbi:MAG: acetylglutamate kinase [Actinobacteria bacterium]|nr:acetylglutamate kinase [Actinomycetota bacterium]